MNMSTNDIALQNMSVRANTQNPEPKEYKRIPTTFSCGGQQWIVNHVERLDNNILGECRSGECVILISDYFNRSDRQDADCCVNTYYHELVHAILSNIGWDELNNDHKFVCSFSALLTEAMKDARFIVKEN